MGHEDEEPAHQGSGLHQVQGGQAQPGGLEAAAGLVAHQVQQQDGQHKAEEGAQPQLGLRSPQQASVAGTCAQTAKGQGPE